MCWCYLAYRWAGEEQPRCTHEGRRRVLRMSGLQGPTSCFQTPITTPVTPRWFHPTDTAKLLPPQLTAVPWSGVTEAKLRDAAYARFSLSHLYSYGNLQKSLPPPPRGVKTDWVSAELLPHAHIQFHHYSNQPQHGPDWIINYPINASLHSVRLSASKYLPMQNNSRRLDFKLSLCAVHNQDRGEGVMGDRGGGRKVEVLHLISMQIYKHHMRLDPSRTWQRKVSVEATTHHSLWVWAVSRFHMLGRKRGCLLMTIASSQITRRRRRNLCGFVQSGEHINIIWWGIRGN